MIRYIVLLLLLLLIPATLQTANVNYGTTKVYQLVRVYDGDTIFVNIRGWPSIAGKNMPIRIAGIDTPEIRGKCVSEKTKAYAAKLMVYDYLSNAKRIQLKNMRRGKYFRIVADVIADGKSVAELLISEGLAVEYDGNTKTHNWCEEQDD